METNSPQRRGFFITIEGGEGVGKSTLINKLPLILKVMGEKTVVTREPGGTTGAEAIRNLLLSPPEGVEWSPLSQTLMFYAARAQHLEQVIQPALELGRVVICDRFSDSTRAYQIVAGGLGMDVLDKIDDMVVGNRQPDLTFILDLPVESAQKRRAERNGKTDPFEKKGGDFHQKVRRAFLNIAATYPDRCVVIDASGNPDSVLEQVVKVLEERLS